jgi:hypothetical protein
MVEGCDLSVGSAVSAKVTPLRQSLRDCHLPLEGRRQGGISRRVVSDFTALLSPITIVMPGIDPASRVYGHPALRRSALDPGSSPGVTKEHGGDAVIEILKLRTA